MAQFVRIGQVKGGQKSAFFDPRSPTGHKNNENIETSDFGPTLNSMSGGCKYSPKALFLKIFDFFGKNRIILIP